MATTVRFLRACVTCARSRPLVYCLFDKRPDSRHNLLLVTSQNSAPSIINTDVLNRMYELLFAISRDLLGWKIQIVFCLKDLFVYKAENKIFNGDDGKDDYGDGISGAGDDDDNDNDNDDADADAAAAAGAAAVADAAAADDDDDNDDHYHDNGMMMIMMMII
ncbi:hypothetical protein PoB_001567500 [Plakobranchus ocellatus]|uniref:Uncharacterized protein n=1 Tax=Plakobranchus ocellatus TaxID=259542 RepID=A0AAV3Z3H6_9GAST|nr:hypothetical protein PoB_001567500 [Plakobranchus ocellatus]